MQQIEIEDRTFVDVAETRQEITLPAIQSDAASLMAVINRAAADPAIDVNKLERLLDMYERVSARTAKAAYSVALAEMQPFLPVVTQKGRIIIKDKTSGEVIQTTSYAKFEDINEAIKPVLAQHGFALSFRIGTALDGKLTVTAILSHKEGHEEDTTITLQHDSTGSKNSVQAVGSSVSYGKRYTAQALLNLTSRGEDDDGQQTVKRKSAAQCKRDGDHDTLITAIWDCKTERELDAWYADFDKHTAHVPNSWLDPMRDKVESRRNEILDAAA